jgi:molybdenum cofactor biosynthesis enzyme
MGPGFWESIMGYPMACANLCPNAVQVNLKIQTKLKLHIVKLEALTAIQVALLTIYDMVKAVE